VGTLAGTADLTGEGTVVLVGTDGAGEGTVVLVGTVAAV